MKKLLSAIAALIIASCSMGAKAEFRYGPTLGADLSTLSFKQDLISIGWAPGAQAGIQGELMFPGIGFGIDIALLYAQRGAKLNLQEKEIWRYEGYTDPNGYRSWLHYVDIPVNLRFKWTRMQGLEDYVAPYVFGGPILSFLAGHNDIEALKYAGADVSLQCGVGFEIMRRWQIQGSYTWGMTYSLKTKLLDDFSARNRTWTVRLTYLF